MSARAADILVIGGGLAGLVAANRAAELGRSVIVLEAGGEERYLCNSRICMGFINVAMGDIEAGPSAMRGDIDKTTRGFAKPELADALANHAQAALRWLRREGVTIVKGTWRPSNQAMLAPPSSTGAGLNWWGRGGDRMLQQLETRLTARGGRLLRGVRARELALHEGACRGVIAEEDGARAEFAADAVLIADGGFQGDPELLKQYVTPRPDRVLVRNAGTGRGDGLRMALAAGAATSGMGGFYGHVQSRDALSNPRLWPYPTVDMPISGGIVVDTKGVRFADEGLGGVHVANAIARRDDPLDTFAIFDHAIWMQRAIEFPRPANPLLVTNGATIHFAGDLETLAVRAGLDSAGLEATVKAYNDSLAAGQGGPLLPPRSSHILKPMPISHPPFYAVPLVAGITYTTGGIAIDGDTRVLREDGSIIRGLHAAGSCTGGHEGGPVSGYTGGLGKAMTFGFIAGNAMGRANIGAAAAE